MTVEKDVDDDIIISSEENFSDSEGEAADVDDSELIPHLLQQKPTLEDRTDQSLIVDGLPIVPADRVQKLSDFLKNKFQTYGKIVTMKMPCDEKGAGKGYAFLVYDDITAAREALVAMHNTRLDVKHTFKVNFLSDYEKCRNAKEEFVPPEKDPFVDIGFLKQWRLDKRCRDQFFIIRGQRACIFWNSSLGYEVIEEREAWSERNLVWSPHGNYLTTFHSRGICIWGGPNFQRYQRLVHPNVFLLNYSPDEKHVVTYSQTQRMDPNSPTTGGLLKVFDVISGKVGRSFDCESLYDSPNALNVASFDPPPQWPLLRWSADGRYFGRLQKDMISVYDSQEGYGLCEKKSIKVPGVQDFAWSPSDNSLAYWVAENSNSPARVVIMEMPSRREITTKNLFSVASITLHWQANGDYLCVKVQRYGKRKVTSKGNSVFVSLSCELEIFHLREKEIPVDKIELKVPSVTALAWEPTGPRFAYIAHVPGTQTPSAQNNQQQNTPAPDNTSSANKYILGVQMVHTERGKVEKLLEQDVSKFRMNHLDWSPKGQFLVTSSLGNPAGKVEWWDMHECVSLNSVLECSYTHVQWDPTGRYVACWASKLTARHDNEVAVFTCVGRPLYKLMAKEFPDLITFAWRPRPPSVLSEVEVKNVKRNLKKYTQKFEVDDKLALQAVNKEFTDKRRNLKSDYCQWRQRLLELLKKVEANAFEKPPQHDENESEVEVTVNIYEATDKIAAV